MVARTMMRLAGAIAILAFLGWAFIVVIWRPLYGDPQARASFPLSDDSSVLAEIESREGQRLQSWAVRDHEALARIEKGLRQAGPSTAPPVGPDRKLTLRLRRPDARLEEYEVILTGRAQDAVYVIPRTGQPSGSEYALRIPGLRPVLEQILKGSPSRSRGD